MKQKQTQNPLQQYFRTEKLFVSLPSGTTYYKDDIVEFTDSGEVGILAMTSKDELVLKNPDSLLNGEAIISLITSCVPSVKNVKKLLNNDIETLLVAIRHATFGDDLDLEATCPSCKKANEFSLSIGQTLESITTLEESYPINLENGITIFVQPFTYTETIKAMKAQFEQAKIVKLVQDDKLSEEDRMRLFSKSFNDLSVLNYDLVASCIIQIVDESNDIKVDNNKFIKEFLENTDRSTIDEIDKLIKSINTIGVKKSFKAVCTHCQHEWEAPIELNPVNFFTAS